MESPRIVLRFALSSLLVSLLALASCAKEQSREQRLREDRVRKTARLQRAAGQYHGYVDLGARGIIPTSLNVSVQMNPSAAGEEKPILQGTLRIGLFGGVILASSSSSFDWGSGLLTFSFAKAKGAGTTSPTGTAESSGPQGNLELRTTVQDGVLTAAVLEGGKQGLFPLKLGKERKPIFSDQPEYRYVWHNDPPTVMKAGPNSGVPPFDALLRMKRLRDNVVSPPGTDLPDLPGIRASLVFPGTARTPQVATQVYYDPLKGTLDLIYGTRSKIEFTEVFYRGEVGAIAALPAEPRALNAEIFLGASSQRKGKLQLLEPTDPEPAMLSVPPPLYVGTYKGSGLRYRAVVHIDDSGTEGTNTDDYPFPSFPNLRLEIAICIDKNEPYQRTSFRLRSLDHLNATAVFQTINATAGSSEKMDVNVSFAPGWKSMEGILIAPDGIRPKLIALERAKIGKNECLD